MGNPHVEIIARGVLIKESRLLVCRNRASGHRFLPGGHVEFGERAADALAREIREEMGVALSVGPFIGATEGSFTQAAKGKQPKRHHEINLVFALSDDAGAVPADGAPPTCEEHITFEWLDLKMLRDGRAGLLPVSAGPMVTTWAAGAAAAAAWASDWE